MPKCWSISTTIRNPERNIPFLKALSEFEGQSFNDDVQRQFFKKLIKTKNYTPTGINNYYKKKYEDPEEFTNEEVEDILSQVHYENAQYNNDQDSIYAFRGRTAVGNLNKMGLVIARQAIGTVTISELGREIMSGNSDLSNVFLRYCLKWQLPNPGERGYKDFNIVPFIAIMHVINNVNHLWYLEGNKPVGVSKEEFSLFLTTLTNYKNIEKTSEDIIKFRKEYRSISNANDRKDFIDNKFIETAINAFELNSSNSIEIERKVNNLHDYGDSAIRYFRQTKLLYYRGHGRYVDLSPTRIVEIEKILNNFDGSIKEFRDLNEYIEYLADINKPVLPWENIEDLKRVYINLLNAAEQLQKEIDNNYKNQALHRFILSEKDLNSISEYNDEINILRDMLKTLNVDLSILRERNFDNLTLYIENLNKLANRRKSISGQDPLNLEWYTALTLMALDDAREINPNYSVGDDNLPIFTAPGDTPDIECYYNDFNIVCEVTLLKSRDQWFNEGQPVMRHLRDFENKEQDKDSFCLFIAPIIHRDTLNTFWFSIKMGYEGKIQKIIPLSIEQYIKILNIPIEKKNQNFIRINNKHIKNLLDLIHEDSRNYMDCTQWVGNFDNIIEAWGYSLK